MNEFTLQFRASEIPALADRYMPALCKKDEEAFDAAARIRTRAGRHTKETLDDLEVIMRWKSRLGLHHFKFNSAEEVYESLDLAMDVEQERSAIAVLCGLDGVAVPMASAIMTVLQEPDDERFTIIDFRALEALGTKMDSPTLAYYLEYLDFLHALKEETGYSLRTIDRALWQWSLEHSNAPIAGVA